MAWFQRQGFPDVGDGGVGRGVAAANENLLAEQNNSEALVPMRAITRGSKFHWFGYYDKLEFDPTNRYILSNEVDFEHRTPPT